MRCFQSKGGRVRLLAGALCACLAVSASADVTYVKADATGNNDGTSWEDAFVYLQDALAVVEVGDEIWVAAGEYRPDQGENQTPGDRESSFEIPHGVSLYGGFDGTEETLEERAGLFEQTILSGDLEGDDQPGFVNVDDNSYTVVRTASGEAGEIVIDGFRITGGNADFEGGQGGGMLIEVSVAVRNTMFEANRADNEGGAVVIPCPPAADVSFEACRFVGNEAGQGGAVWIDGCFYPEQTFTFSDCEFVGNEAHYDGGAVWSSYGHFAASLVFIRCEFEGNAAAGGGGAAFHDYFHADFRDCAFRNNTAGQGGAVWTPVTEMTGCVFEQNTAFSGGAVCCTSEHGGGGGVISDCHFVRNTAQEGGGLYHFAGEISLERCSFIENMATELSTIRDTIGGGACLQSRSEWTFLRDCMFVGNVAVDPDGASGGALQIRSDDLLATGCLFEENSASEGGGAISFDRSGRYFWFYNSAFRRNTATSGGAISVEADNPKFVQSVFAGNTATEDGGAVYLYWFSPPFINCAVFANTANGHGGGIFSGEYGQPKVRNTILWNNQDQDGTGESSQISGGTPDIRFSCIQGWTGDLEGIATFGDDPLFVDPFGPDGIPGTEDDDLHLSPGSPVIDRGCNWLVRDDWGDLDGDGDTGEFLPLDLDGEGRFFDDPNTPDDGCGAPIVDLGPYEVGGSGPQPCHGDVDGNGGIDLDDLACLLSSYGTDHTDPDYNSVCDFNGAGQVDLDDLATLLAVYGTECE